MELKYLEQQAKQASSLLAGIISQSENLPKTRFYKGKEGIQIICNEIIQDRTDIWIMSDGQHFYDLIDNDFLERSLVMRKQYGIHVSLLFPS